VIKFVGDRRQYSTLYNRSSGNSREAGYHENPSGSGQFPPEMMMELLIYSYATGKFSSYEIEKATYNDVPAGYICANTHPDHNTVNNFRNSNREAFKNVFTKVLVPAQNTGIINPGACRGH
jgi:transposase